MKKIQSPMQSRMHTFSFPGVRFLLGFVLGVSSKRPSSLVDFATDFGEDTISYINHRGNILLFIGLETKFICNKPKQQQAHDSKDNEKVLCH